MIRPVDRLKVLAYLRERHPRGVTRGELRAYVVTGKRATALELQATLDSFVQEGLASVACGLEKARWYSPGQMQLYTATTKLMTRSEIRGGAR